MGRSRKVEARERARAAKARFDAEREKRDKEITEHSERFFLAAADRDDAREAVARAEADMDATVAAMVDDLGMPAADVARLCDLTSAEVRAMRKRVAARGEEATATDDAAEQLAGVRTGVDLAEGSAPVSTTRASDG